MWNMIWALAIAVVAAFGARAQNIDEALQKIANFKFGEDREPLSVVNDLVRKADNSGNPADRKAIEDKLLALLKTNPSPDCVDFICRQLMMIGSEASVPVLEPMLAKDEKSADFARYALEGIAGDEVDKALLRAAQKTSGRTRVGILNSLGNRKSNSAVSALARYTKDQDKAVAAAAIAALGQIGGEEAAKAIAKVREGDNKKVADDAYLACATAFLEAGEKDKAAKILDDLIDAKEPVRVRGAALTAMNKAEPGKTQEKLIALLKGDDEYLRAIAVGLLRKSDEKSATTAVAQVLPALKPDAQVLALGILEHRGDKAALGAVTAMASSPDTAVKVAALHALGVLGDSGSVPLLLTAATSTEEEAKRTANEALDTLRGADIDQMMLSAMSGADVEARAVLIRSLSTRGAKVALPALFDATGDPNDGIRAKAFDALGMLAGPDELPKLLDLVVKLNGNSAQPQAESAVVAVSQKVPDSKARANATLAALDAAKDERVRASLTKIAGRIGEASALPKLRELAAESKEATVQEAAVRALCDWTTTETLDDLRKLAAESKNDTFRGLAFAAMIRVARMEDGGPDLETKLKVYTEALSVAKTPDDKRLVLAGLGRVADSRALELAKKLEQDEAVKEEAKQAIEQITKAMEKK